MSYSVDAVSGPRGGLTTMHAWIHDELARAMRSDAVAGLTLAGNV